MNRRNFIAGLGALAVGSGAAIGTGAFNSASAARSATVNVAGDSRAYLALESTSEYAVETGNTLEIDFGQAVSGGGQNVAEDSVIVVGNGDFTDTGEHVFVARNQGTNPVEITPQFIEIAFDNTGTILRRATSENGKQAIFSPDEDSVPEGTELAMGIYNKYYQGPAELESGDSIGYYIVVATGDDPPSSVSPTFEINANEV